MKARPRILVHLWKVVVLFSVVVIVGTLLRWWLDTAPPIEIISAQAREDAVHRGGFLTIDYQSRVHRACSGASQRVIVDSQEVLQLIEPTPVYLSEEATTMGRSHTTVIIPVPTGAAYGPARYQAVLNFQCNPLQHLLGRSIEVRTPLIRFEILPTERPALERLPYHAPVPPKPKKAGLMQISHIATPSAWPIPAPSRPADAARKGPDCRVGQVPVRAHYRRAGSSLRFVRAYCRRAPDRPVKDG